MVQQAAYHVQLLITREDQGFLCQQIGRLALQQHEMLDDARKAGGQEHLFPQIGGLVAVRVWRVAVAVVVPLVERQEKGGGAGQLGDPMLNFYIHRSFSIIILTLNVFLFVRNRKLQLGFDKIKAVLILIGIEILSGMAMYYLDFPDGSQPIHLVIASLLFGLQFYLVLETKKTTPHSDKNFLN